MMKIGAQLFTLRDFAKTAEERNDTLKKVADIGYKYVQVSGFGDYDPAEIKASCDQYGLSIELTHYNFDKILNETQATIEAHKIMGCNRIGIGSMPKDYRETGLEGVRQFLKDIEKPATMMRENGMQFEYHNHGFEFEKYEDKSLFDVLVYEGKPELLKFILDTYWVQYGGKNPEKKIRELKGRIDVCHFKDMKMREQEQRFAAIGDGNLDWDAIIKACEETGIEFAMIEQDKTYDESPFDELKRSYDFLKKYE